MNGSNLRFCSKERILPKENFVFGLSVKTEPCKNNAVSIAPRHRSSTNHRAKVGNQGKQCTLVGVNCNWDFGRAVRCLSCSSGRLKHSGHLVTLSILSHERGRDKNEWATDNCEPLGFFLLSVCSCCFHAQLLKPNSPSITNTAPFKPPTTDQTMAGPQNFWSYCKWFFYTCCFQRIFDFFFFLLVASGMVFCFGVRGPLDCLSHVRTMFLTERLRHPCAFFFCVRSYGWFLLSLSSFHTSQGICQLLRSRSGPMKKKEAGHVCPNEKKLVYIFLSAATFVDSSYQFSSLLGIPKIWIVFSVPKSGVNCLIANESVVAGQLGKSEVWCYWDWIMWWSTYKISTLMSILSNFLSLYSYDIGKIPDF